MTPILLLTGFALGASSGWIACALLVGERREREAYRQGYARAANVAETVTRL